MKKVSNKLKAIVLLMAIVFCFPIICQAQPDPGGAPDVPLDGGISLVLIAGGIIGAKKVRDNQKNKENI
ncbi:MAG: PID-CTERM protein-sorting domain-containing protein [Chitinophagaceae bacterium]